MDSGGRVPKFGYSEFLALWKSDGSRIKTWVPSACFVFTNSLHRNLIAKFRINSPLSMRKKTQISGDSAMIESIHGALTDPLVYGPRKWIRFTRSKRYIYHCENVASLVHANAGISPSLVSERRFEIQSPTKNRIWLFQLRFLNDCSLCSGGKIFSWLKTLIIIKRWSGRFAPQKGELEGEGKWKGKRNVKKRREQKRAQKG